MNKKSPMKLEELGELYRLLISYQTKFEIKESSWLFEALEEIKQCYEMNAYRINGPSGYSIVPPKVTNPKGAGRNPLYTDQEKIYILELRNLGWSIRKIADKVHCSVGFVHKIINEQIQ